MRRVWIYSVKVLCLVILLFMFSGWAIYVPFNYKKIQDAINAASAGDIINIAPGVYNKDSQIFPITIKNGVTLLGAGRDATVIDATGAGEPALRIDTSTTSATAVKNLTVTGGVANDNLGGAITIFQSSAARLENLLITDNFSTGTGGIGGGVAVVWSNAYIENCEFSNNRAYNGGAIGTSGFSSNLSIVRCNIHDNIADNDGGAVSFADSQSIFVDQSAIHENTSKNGTAGISISDTLAFANQAIITGCNFYRNNGRALDISHIEAGLVGKCRFLSNVSIVGAAIKEKYSSIVYDKNIIAFNRASGDAAAIHSEWSNSKYSNNYIYKNISQTKSIVNFTNNVGAKFIHNTVVENAITSGTILLANSIIRLETDTMPFANNIIAFNQGVGFVEGNAISDPIFIANCLYNNTMGNYLDEGTILFNSETEINYAVANAPSGSSFQNMVADPIFKDILSNDYRLKGISPVIDKGTSNYYEILDDYENQMRYVAASNHIPDIGADEALRPTIYNPVVYIDTDQSETVNKNDKLILQLDRPVNILDVVPFTSFALPVVNDNLGVSPSLAINPNNRSQLIITLGEYPHLTIEGVFEDYTTVYNSPSGLDFAAVGSNWIPIADDEGLYVCNHGTSTGANTDVPDIKHHMKSVTADFDSKTSGVLTVSGDGVIYNTRIEIPVGSVLLPCRLRLSSPAVFERSLSVIRLEVIEGYLVIDPSKPFRLVLQYFDQELNLEAGDTARDFRIFKFVQTSPLTWEWVYVRDAYGYEHVLDEANKTISCYISDIYGTQKADLKKIKNGELNKNNAKDYLTQPPIDYANLPLEIISENTITIKSGKKKEAETSKTSASAKSSKAAKTITPISDSASVASLQPAAKCYYPKHKIEFPGYVLSDAGIKVKIRKPTLVERLNFPTDDNSILVLETKDSATNSPISFSDPVNITVQYRDAYDDPTFKDISYSDSSSAIESQMKMVKYDFNTTQFDFLSTRTDTLNKVENTLYEPSVANLTTNGKGIYGSYADQSVVHVSTFDYGSDNWAFGYVQDLKPTSPVDGGGYLTQIVTEPSEFAFWVSPASAFPMANGKTYFMQFAMNSQIIQTKCPQIRLRMFPGNFEYSTDISMNPRPGDGYNMPKATTERYYNLLFTPPAALFSESFEPKELFAAFDVIHFVQDPSIIGPISLDTFTLKVFDTSEIMDGMTSVMRFDFNSDAEGWIGGTFSGFDPADMSWESGALKVSSHTHKTFSIYNRVLPFEIDTGKLYMVRMGIRTNVVPGYMVPSFRMRVGTNDHQFWQVQLFSSLGESLMSPNEVTRDYDVYFYPEQESIDQWTSELVVAFDILNLSTDDNAECTFWIDYVDILAKDFDPL